uniref:Secreted protein n=1 Tax=Romanomermis culicivorax TaxID=13658 RepID=A0A915HN74_ROMCU
MAVVQWAFPYLVICASLVLASIKNTDLNKSLERELKKTKHGRLRNAVYPLGYYKDCSGPIAALKFICQNCFNSPVYRKKREGHILSYICSSSFTKSSKSSRFLKKMTALKSFEMDKTRNMPKTGSYTSRKVVMNHLFTALIEKYRRVGYSALHHEDFIT